MSGPVLEYITICRPHNILIFIPQFPICFDGYSRLDAINQTNRHVLNLLVFALDLI